MLTGMRQPEVALRRISTSLMLGLRNRLYSPSPGFIHVVLVAPMALLVVIGVRAIDEFVVEAEQMANDIATEHTARTISEALRPVGAKRIRVVLKVAAPSRGYRRLGRDTGMTPRDYRRERQGG